MQREKQAQSLPLLKLLNWRIGPQAYVYPCGLDSLESIPGLLKSLKIPFLLRSSGIDSKDSIPQGYICWPYLFLGSLEVYKFGLSIRESRQFKVNAETEFKREKSVTSYYFLPFKLFACICIMINL
jgi:hypothetical protein